MSLPRNLIIDGIAIPIYTAVRLRQSYFEIAARSRRRTASGRSIQRTVYSGLLGTEIGGEGRIPVGLSGVNWDAAITIACIQHRGILSASPNIALPTKRRADAGSEPYGWAFVNGLPVNTPCAMNGDIAELTPVTGATQYEAIYFPLLTCHADAPREDKQGRGPHFGWSMTAEEVE